MEEFLNVENKMISASITSSLNRCLHTISWTNLAKPVTTPEYYEESKTGVLEMAKAVSSPDGASSVQELLVKHFGSQMNSEAVAVLVALLGKDVNTKKKGVSFLANVMCFPISQTRVYELAVRLKSQMTPLDHSSPSSSRSHGRSELRKPKRNRLRNRRSRSRDRSRRPRRTRSRDRRSRTRDRSRSRSRNRRTSKEDLADLFKQLVEVMNRERPALGRDVNYDRPVKSVYNQKVDRLKKLLKQWQYVNPSDWSAGARNTLLLRTTEKQVLQFSEANGFTKGYDHKEVEDFGSLGFEQGMNFLVTLMYQCPIRREHVADFCEWRLQVWDFPSSSSRRMEYARQFLGKYQGERYAGKYSKLFKKDFSLLQLHLAPQPDDVSDSDDQQSDESRSDGSRSRSRSR